MTSPSPDLALGIDLGTSGVRSAVIDAQGAVWAMARGTYGPTSQDGRDPERWWNAVCACFDDQVDALRGAGIDPSRIARIGVDGTSGTVVLTDAALAPVSRALMYDDAGFDAEAALIARHAPSDHVANGPGSALARALRLVAEDPGRTAAHLLHQADFVAARLMARGGLTDDNNALKMGLDPGSGDWPAWLSHLPLPPGLLPEARPPGTPFAPIAPQIARRFGLRETAMVHAGTTDSVAAFLAAAEPVPGAAVTSLGTTLAVKLCAPIRIDAPELGLYAHRVAGTWLVGGASNTGGGVLRHFFTVPEIEALSAHIDPALPSPLDYYPLLKPGERFPANDPHLAPRLSPRPGDDAAFLHGLLEGMARIEKRAYDVLAERGAGYPGRVLTAGGGAANAVWSGIRARILGVPVVSARTPEAAIGVARLVMSARRQARANDLYA